MQTRNPNNPRIIDVSHHQGVIDWIQVADDGIQGAMIKASEGIGYIDPLFRQNATEAISAGLRVGFYHYARPESGNTPEQEVEAFMGAISGLRASLPLVLDLEGEAADLGPEKVTEWA